MSGPSADQEFISEPIEPVAGSFDASGMARGEAGLPREFVWRGCAYTVARVISMWKSSSADRGEMYLRRHWFEIETTSSLRMTLYCERQASSAKNARRRWFLYTLRRCNRSD